MILEGCSSRFPHSEISGSKSICDSPKHIGAYPVLHRLLVPRHSPYALNILTYLLLYFIYIAICSFQCSVYQQVNVDSYIRSLTSQICSLAMLVQIWSSLRMTYHQFVSQIGLGQLGGDEEDRTPDPLLARQVLSQLSYTPTISEK